MAKLTDIYSINLEKDKVDYFTASELRTPSGILVAPKGVKLNTSLLNRLKKFEVHLPVLEHIAKEKDSILMGGMESGIMSKSSEPLTLPPQKKIEIKPPTRLPASVKKQAFSKTFEEYREDYTEQVEAISDCMDYIKQGEDIKPEVIDNMLNSMMESVPDYRDAFSYLFFLQNYDDHTYHHSCNVAIMSSIFADWLGLNEEDKKTLTLAAMLHDIGKTEIEKEIVEKPGILTNEEFERMKEHTTIGYDLLRKAGLPETICNVALRHHERIDGSGYPFGLSEYEIDDFSKIIAILDVYDAICSKRAYRDKASPFDVISKFEFEMYGLLCTEKLLFFLKHIAGAYVGSSVELSTKDHAEIIFIDPFYITRPVVKLSNGEIISLVERREIEIINLV